MQSLHLTREHRTLSACLRVAHRDDHIESPAMHRRKRPRRSSRYVDADLGHCGYGIRIQGACLEACALHFKIRAFPLQEGFSHLTAGAVVPTNDKDRQLQAFAYWLLPSGSEPRSKKIGWFS